MHSLYSDPPMVESENEPSRSLACCATCMVIYCIGPTFLIKLLLAACSFCNSVYVCANIHIIYESESLTLERALNAESLIDPNVQLV